MSWSAFAADEAVAGARAMRSLRRCGSSRVRLCAARPGSRRVRTGTGMVRTSPGGLRDCGSRSGKQKPPRGRGWVDRELRRAEAQNGRRERIRTSGPYVPNVVLYQAELLSGPRGRRSYSGSLCAPQPLKSRPDIALKGGRRASMVRHPKPGFHGHLGRRQVVRHRILIPAFGGSNPPAPASPHPRCPRFSWRGA